MRRWLSGGITSFIDFLRTRQLSKRRVVLTTPVTVEGGWVDRLGKFLQREWLGFRGKTLSTPFSNYFVNDFEKILKCRLVFLTFFTTFLRCFLALGISFLLDSWNFKLFCDIFYSNRYAFWILKKNFKLSWKFCFQLYYSETAV